MPFVIESMVGHGLLNFVIRRTAFPRAEHVSKTDGTHVDPRRREIFAERAGVDVIPEFLERLEALKRGY